MSFCGYSLSWGGLDSDPNWVLGEQDFPTWPPSDLDKYRAPAEWTLEAKRPRSTLIEAWRRNALNQALMFPLLYGNDASAGLPRLTPSRSAIERLHQLHLTNPDKYTLSFVKKTRAMLNSRRVEELKEQVNKICLLRKVERPTFAELKETGLSPDPVGQSILRFPTTFDLDSPHSFFQQHVLGSFERDFDRLRWGQYRKSPLPPSGRNAGTPTPIGLNMTTRGRRFRVLQAPRATQGSTICWDFNAHHGCSETPCAYFPSGGKQTFRNYETLKTPLEIYLLKHGGLRAQKPEIGDIPKKIKELVENSHKKTMIRKNKKRTPNRNKFRPKLRSPTEKTDATAKREKRTKKSTEMPYPRNIIFLRKYTT